MELKFRTLKANEIEVRVGSGGTLLLYKDARCDMALLDEVVGVGNWQREHKILGEDIYCKVGIFNKELNCWIWVEDAGSSGNIEIEKTKASDSFKRACVNLGIGRELYTAPKIKIPDRFKNTQFFEVKEIEYNTNREITTLVITTDFGKTKVYEFRNGRKVNLDIDTNPTTTLPKKDVLKEATKGIGDSFLEESAITQETKASIQAIVDKLSGDRYNDFKNWLSDNFGETNIGALSEKQGQQVLKSFTRGK